MTQREDEGNIDWNETIKKEAQGVNDDDLGEVQEIGNTFVKTKKGLLSKEEFYLPKYLVEGYDGHVVRFNITKEEADEKFTMESATEGYAAKYKHISTKTETESDKDMNLETRIPLIGEELKVYKTKKEGEARIRKESVTEQRTVDVPVTHEELEIERRSVNPEKTNDRPVTKDTDVTIPLSSEEVHVTKEPYVKEEVVIRKKPVTETETVTEDVTSETIKAGTSKET